MAGFVSLDGLFAGRHFDREIIILCVRWPSRRESAHGPMLGFKRFKTAAITLAGIELMRRIYKRQFDLSRLRLQGKTAPEIWNTVLAE
jgi:hypothetical protein